MAALSPGLIRSRWEMEGWLRVAKGEEPGNKNIWVEYLHCLVSENIVFSKEFFQSWDIIVDHQYFWGGPLCSKHSYKILLLDIPWHHYEKFRRLESQKKRVVAILIFSEITELSSYKSTSLSDLSMWYYPLSLYNILSKVYHHILCYKQTFSIHYKLF